MANEFEVIVIGSGQGGDPFAREAASRGMKTALIERDLIGGTCINRGCTPTKTMIASGRVVYLARRGPEYGVLTGAIRVDMPKILERKRSIVKEFRESGEQKDEKAPNLTLIRSSAHFMGPHELEAGGWRLAAKIIVIDAGGVPKIPQIQGLDSIPYLTSESVMELDEVPRHLVVLGGGYVGVEFAQLFRRLGSEVTLVERSNQLLSREDEDIAETLADVFREDGIRTIVGASAKAASGTGREIHVDIGKEVLHGTHLLVALGRRPNVKDLALEAAGIATGKRGEITVDERLETNVPGVYAIGDVNGGPQFTHISYDDFRILRDNLFEGGNQTTTGRMTPYTVFTDPQLGRIGLSEKEAKSKGVRYELKKLPMDRVARALETGESRGFMKALVDSDSKQILGAAVLGLEGGELANMIQIAMMGKLPYTALREGIFSHPTLGESLNNLFM